MTDATRGGDPAVERALSLAEAEIAPGLLGWMLDREQFVVESPEQRLADELVDALAALPADGPNVVKLRPLYDAIIDYRSRRAVLAAAQERGDFDV